MKKVLIIVCLVLAIGAWYRFWYKPHSVEHSMINGDITSLDGSLAADSQRSATPPSEAPKAPQVTMPGATGESGTTPQAVSTSGAAKPPAADTISPNPPNGMVFSGTGRFQVYRQGNLTWRVNTENGKACILFATGAEWRKPQVYERGCSNT